MHGLSNRVGPRIFPNISIALYLFCLIFRIFYLLLFLITLSIVIALSTIAIAIVEFSLALKGDSDKCFVTKTEKAIKKRNMNQYTKMIQKIKQRD